MRVSAITVIARAGLGLLLSSPVLAQSGTAGLDEQAQQVINEPNFGSPFDDRYWIGVSGGVTFSDRDDYDNGPALLFSFGKTIYENLAVQAEGFYSSLEVADVANTSTSADYERWGGGVSGQLLLPFGRFVVGPTVGASYRRIEFVGAVEDGLAAHAGLGALVKVGKRIDLTLDARYNLDFTDGTYPISDTTFYSWTATVGARMKLGTWPPKPPDTDGDGVPDYRDDCPNTPPGVIVNARGCALDEDRDGVPDYKDRCPGTPPGVAVDEHGCPLDSDGDGVPDILDECPDTPPNTPVDARGCPLDTDQDGVINSKDLCPNTPFGAEVDVHGCPFDTDQDGVPDFRDECPNTPQGTPVNDRGCALDSDGDGVPDSIDQCPNTFPGLAVDKVGCPLKDQVLVLNNVRFEFDRSDLLPDSRTLLEQVAASLKDQPEL
ncbi:MAG: thrombospondin type 3 repeat-containing protein, partial [Oceanococcaceae bacterium]